MKSFKLETLDLPTAPVWYKVSGMLCQDWAVVMEEDVNNAIDACIYFFNDHGEVFDSLSVCDAAHADLALALNGFRPLDDNPGFRAIVRKPEFPLKRSERWINPVYSSGQHWVQIKKSKSITKRREITPVGLERFVKAQEPIIDNAISELENGKKLTHWMWFVFPQLNGLGHSSMSIKYGIINIQEAKDYLAHPILGPRLDNCFRIVLKHSDKPIDEIFGSTDAQKFHSCATLFCNAVSSEESIFKSALKIFFDGKLDNTI